MMEKYPIGMRVCNKVCFPGDENRFSGTIVGHGWARGMPMILVQLDEGAYIENDCVKAYISTIIVHPDGLQEE